MLNSAINIEIGGFIVNFEQPIYSNLEQMLLTG